MKRIGIIGGLGPESTIYYYRTLIDLSLEKQGARNKSEVEVLIYNLNHAECADILVNCRWPDLANIIVDAAERLYRAGADFAIIACNTAHLVFDDVAVKSPIPLISIVEETCEAVAKLGLVKVGLLGSIMTMESQLYQNVFNKKNIAIVVPNKEERVYIQNKIRWELAVGIMQDEARKGFLEIAQRMVEKESIQGLILGCTEIPLLLTKEEFGIPFFNTSKIHAESAFRKSYLS